MGGDRSGRRVLVLFAAAVLALGTLLGGVAVAETIGGGGSGGDGTPTEPAPSTTDPTATVVSTSPSNGGDSGGNSSGGGSGDAETGTAVPGVDLEVTKTDSPDPVTAGSNLTYTVAVVNNGDTDAPDVMVFDDPPDEAPVLSAGASQGSCSVGGGGPSCSLGSIAGGASATATFNAFVLPDTPAGTITNTAAATTTATDGNTSNNLDAETTTVTTVADVGVAKGRFPAPVPTGTNLTYSITAADLGPSDAQDVTLTDALPAGTTFVSLSAPADWSATTPAVGGTGTVTATTSTLGALDAAVFTLVVNVNAPSGSLIDNTATVTTTTADPAPENNSATAQAPVSGSADLSVTKSDTPDPVSAGNNLTYTITATNGGGDFANNVTLADTLPAGTAFVSLASPAGWSCTTPAAGATGTVSCSNPSVAPATSGMFTVVVEVNAAVADGSTISNTTSVSSSTFDPDASNNSATATTAVTATADLSVTKTDSPDPVIAGTDLTYTIGVANNGPSDAAGDVTLTDPLPAGTTFVSATPSQGACSGTTTVSCNLGPMANGASATVTVVVHVGSSAAEGSAIANTASASSPANDPNQENNSASSDTDVVTSADVSLTKQATPDPVTAGTDLTYTITATNDGPSDAQDVTVTDPLPAGTTFVSVAPSQGSCSGTTTVTCDLGTLADGVSATITLVVHVDGATPGGTVITNTATESSPDAIPELRAATADPTEANNSASVSVTVLAAPRAPDATAGAPAGTTTGAAAVAVAVVAVPRFTG